MEIVIYSQNGTEAEKMSLPKDIFEAKINHDLMYRALNMQLSNARQPIAHTLKRDERAGSTRKLFRQKGTGRARSGAIRSPLHKKAGVVFGPRNERNFQKNMSKGERRHALFSALSAKANDKAILGLSAYEGAVSTKDFSIFLKKLPLEKSVLVVLADKHPIVQKSSNNLPQVKTILVNYLNVRDLLQYKSLVFMKDALEKLPTVFSSQTSK